MCEKCWGEAYGRTKYDPLKSQAEHYRDILREKAERGEVCTEAEQRGEATR